MAKKLAMVSLLLGATAAAYLPSVDGEFVLDDMQLVGDRRITAPFAQGAAAWLTLDRPVTAFTFALNHLAVGLETRGWHLTNVAIHLATVVLAWRFARLTLARAGFSRPDGALAAAGLFALHPIQTESVAYLTQRAESLASGLYLAALLALLARDEATSTGRRIALLAAAFALHLLGLAAKPIVVTLPVAWLLHSTILPAAAEGDGPAWKRSLHRLPAAMGLLALSAGFAIGTLAATTRTTTSGFGVIGLPPLSYAATELRVVATYLRLLVWPAGQCADWFVRISNMFSDPAVLGSAALLAVLFGGAIFVALRFGHATGDVAGAARAASFGVLFFFVVLAPTSTVVPLRDPLAEHRVYLPALGIFVAAVPWAALAVRRWVTFRAPLAGAALTVALLAVLGIATARRSAVWTSRLALWSDAARNAPQKARVHVGLGYALRAANRPEDALVEFYLARRLAKDHTVTGAALLDNIVVTLLALGRVDDARAEVARVLARAPWHPGALASLAMIEFESDREDESERAARNALVVDPSNTTALTYLGKIRMRRGDLAGAREALGRAAAARDADAAVSDDLGALHERSGAIDEACAAYRRATQLPGDGWATAHARASRERLQCR